MLSLPALLADLGLPDHAQALAAHHLPAIRGVSSRPQPRAVVGASQRWRQPAGTLVLRFTAGDAVAVAAD